MPAYNICSVSFGSVSDLFHFIFISWHSKLTTTLAGGSVIRHHWAYMLATVLYLWGSKNIWREQETQYTQTSQRYESFRRYSKLLLLCYALFLILIKMNLCMNIASRYDVNPTMMDPMNASLGLWKFISLGGGGRGSVGVWDFKAILKCTSMWRISKKNNNNKNPNWQWHQHGFNMKFKFLKTDTPCLKFYIRL